MGDRKHIWEVGRFIPSYEALYPISESLWNNNGFAFVDLIMDAVSTHETSTNFYEITLLNIPEESQSSSSSPH
jgi:hypothetical protein